MTDSDHDVLLAAAVKAHEDYLNAGKVRAAAFKRALSGTVTATELAQKIGLSVATVTRIPRRQ